MRLIEGKFASNRSDVDTNVVNVGPKYGYGAANVRVGWTYSMHDENDLDDRHLFVVSGDAGILPGVMGICQDPNVRDDTILKQDPIGGVVSLRPDSSARRTVRSSRCIGCEAGIFHHPVP